ncbi:MAG: ribonuclease Z [Oscillospiraceae bacterium]|nr:ribonuclease Z [Oscillospiraceae bacterium]
MKLIVCLDDRNGMLFNKRRQSSDIRVTHKILEIASARPIWMNKYSAYLFAEQQGNIHIAENFLEQAYGDVYCFVENVDLTPYLSMTDELIVFRWNRLYPSDFCLPELPETLKKTSSEDFQGNSHERITMEVYRSEK